MRLATESRISDRSDINQKLASEGYTSLLGFLVVLGKLHPLNMGERFEMNKIKLRNILQHYYDTGKTASQACERIRAVYGYGTLSESTARRWFARFRSGDFDVKDKPRSGRPVTDKADEILAMIRRNKYLSSPVIGAKLGISHKTVLNHLHRAGYRKMHNAWVRQRPKLGNKARNGTKQKRGKRRN